MGKNLVWLIGVAVGIALIAWMLPARQGRPVRPGAKGLEIATLRASECEISVYGIARNRNAHQDAHSILVEFNRGAGVWRAAPWPRGTYLINSISTKGWPIFSVDPSGLPPDPERDQLVITGEGDVGIHFPPGAIKAIRLVALRVEGIPLRVVLRTYLATGDSVRSIATVRADLALHSGIQDAGRFTEPDPRLP